MGSIGEIRLKDIDELPDSTLVVIVERYFPWWIKEIKSKCDLFLPILSPSKELLTEYKELKKKYDFKTIAGLIRLETRFRRQVLNDSKALDTLRKLKVLSKDYNVVFVCRDPIGTITRPLLMELMMKYQLGD